MPKVAVTDDALFGKFLIVFSLILIFLSVIISLMLPNIFESYNFDRNVGYIIISIPFAFAITWALIMLKAKDWEVIEKAGYAYFPQRDVSEKRIHFYGRWKKIYLELK